MKTLGWFAELLLGRIAPNRGRDPNRPYVPFKLQGPPPLTRAKRFTWYLNWKAGEVAAISAAVKNYSVQLRATVKRRIEARARARRVRQDQIKEQKLNAARLKQKEERARVLEARPKPKVEATPKVEAQPKQEVTTGLPAAEKEREAKLEKETKQERRAKAAKLAAEARQAKKDKLAAEAREARLEQLAKPEHLDKQEQLIQEDKQIKDKKPTTPVQPPPSQPIFKPVASRSSSASRKSDTLGAGWADRTTSRELPRQYYGPPPAPPKPKRKSAQSFISREPPREPSIEPSTEALPEPEALAEHYEQMKVLQSPALEPRNTESVSPEIIDYLMDITQRQAQIYQGPYERFSIEDILKKVYGMPGAARSASGDMPKVSIRGYKEAIAYAQYRCYQWPNHTSIFVDASCTSFSENAIPIPKPTSVAAVVKNKLPVGRASLFVSQNDEWTIRGFHSKESLDSRHSEAIAILQGVRMIYDQMEQATLEGRPVDKAHVDIFSDSQTELRSIKNIEETGHRRGQLLEKVCEMCIELKKVGVTIELHWVPGHTDNTESETKGGSARKVFLPTQRVPGNILADIVAVHGSKRGRGPFPPMAGSAGTRYGTRARSAIK